MKQQRILRVIEIVSSIETSLRYSTQQRAVLETALIKATMPETDYNIDALIARITALESELKSLKENGVTVKEKVANILTKISPQFHLSTSRILLQSCEFFKVTFKNVSKSQFQRHNFKLIHLKKNFHEKIRFLKVNVTKPII